MPTFKLDGKEIPFEAGDTIIRAAWRQAEELQLSAPLALEALLHRLRRELAGPAMSRA